MSDDVVMAYTPDQYFVKAPTRIPDILGNVKT